MSQEVESIDLGNTDAPENKEKVYVQPGYRKLKIESFTYEKEEDGKTPLISMKCTAPNPEGGDDATLEEKLYVSGKLNKQQVMSSVVRLQELYKGLTGDPKMTIKPSAYRYTKKEKDGSSQDFVIPNPKELCDYLQQKCAGKTAIFKVAGEEGRDGTVYSKLAYSGFLYYTKNGELCRYREEKEFSETEKRYNIQKKKDVEAPAHSNGIANETGMDAL